MKLCCKCLNVKVHCKDGEISEKLSDFQSAQLSEAFSDSGVHRVTLDIGGVTKEQAALVKKEYFGDWMAFYCLNCKMRCYATCPFQQSDSIFVSTEMYSEPGQQTKLMQCSNYSPVYKILILGLENEKKAETLMAGGGGSHRKNSSSLDTAILQLHQQMAKYIKKETELAEERIRKYTEQQHVALMELRTGTNSHKQCLIRVLRQEEDGDICDNIREAMLDASPSTSSSSSSSQAASNNDHPVDVSMLTDSGSQNDSSSLLATQIQNNGLTQNLEKLPPAPPLRHLSMSAVTEELRSLDVADPIFDMDDIQNNEDDDGDDAFDDTSGDSDENNYETHREMVTKFEYARSLPVTVPMRPPQPLQPVPDGRRQQQLHQEQPNKPDRIRSAKAEDIAASMALAFAQSVTDGTEMFGELPRPRVNTAGGTAVKTN